MRRSHWILVAAVLLLAAVLRHLLLGSKSYWLDEAFSVSIASKPFATLWQRSGVVPEPHPPLYYTMLYGWVRLAGTSEAAVRLPSALISVTNVALLYALGRRLCDRRVGLTAAALLAVSPLAVWYGQEARMYAFVTTAGLLTALLLTWPSWAALPLLALTLTAGLYIDYTFIPLLVALSAIWLWRWNDLGRDPKAFFIWLCAIAIATLAYLPWLQHLLKLLTQLDRIFIFETLLALLNLPTLPPLAYVAGLLALGVAVWLGCVVVAWLLRDEARRRWLGLLIIVAFGLLLVGFALPRGFALKKLLLLGWPYGVLLVAWLLVDLGRDRLTIALIAAGLAASLLMVWLVPKDDWRGVAARLQQDVDDSAEVWIMPHWNGVPLDVYAPELPVRHGTVDELAASDSAEVWIVSERFPGQSVPATPHERWLDDTYELVEAVPFYRLELRHYAQKNGD